MNATRSNAATDTLPYYIGCPVWACNHWVGNFYSTSNRSKWLDEYSSVFNTVEGNSTFYGIPDVKVATKWAQETRDGFRFCLKFPQSITHQCQLMNAESETNSFLQILDILSKANRLGPSFIQLPPNFNFQQLESLERYLANLPPEYPYAVEVRHLDFFDDGQKEQTLNDVLTRYGVDKVLFDSRPLYSAPPSDDAEAESQRRKPKSPYRTTATGNRPLVRFIGRNKPAEAAAWMGDWCEILIAWIAEGRTPYIMLHAPDDQFAPSLCELFHQHMKLAWQQKHQNPMSNLPSWPSKSVAKQGLLF